MSYSTLPTGQSDARFSTTAAVAETDASTTTLSSEVQKNADKLRTAAIDAAHSASFNEPKPISTIDQLEQGLSQKTDVAVSQGAHDVQSAKAAASGYVEEAKALAGNVLSTAQSYVSGTSHPSTSAEKGVGTNDTHASRIGATVQAAIVTGKEYLASAQAAAQPYIESAASTAQAQAERVKGAVSGTQANSAVSGQPFEVPSKTAPLESGPHAVTSPYSESGVEGQPAKKVAEL
ncbi:hypothetical protein V8D89_012368 [Ganoderma adspersum]